MAIPATVNPKASMQTLTMAWQTTMECHFPSTKTSFAEGAQLLTNILEHYPGGCSAIINSPWLPCHLRTAYKAALEEVVDLSSDVIYTVDATQMRLLLRLALINAVKLLRRCKRDKVPGAEQTLDYVLKKAHRLHQGVLNLDHPRAEAKAMELYRRERRIAAGEDVDGAERQDGKCLDFGCGCWGPCFQGVADGFKSLVASIRESASHAAGCSSRAAAAAFQRPASGLTKPLLG